MKIIAIPFTLLHVLIFFIILLVFHPVQWLCLKLGGYSAHKFSVEILNWFLLKSALPLGIIFTFENKQELESGKSYIIVANHQSMFDIPPIIWYLRKVHPKFISKKELGKGIPSVSFNLRHSGAALIDRKDPRQALTEITRFAKAMHQNKRSAVIFPEGTRSRNGTMKSFSYNGLKVMFKQMPEAKVL
ncbi:MAG: lysophospholipid acyltransferase family protein, partial [Flavobacteriaceae bacterium]|nr:lysophospholipid acyltransferase family protein [Flavobacteriaceae bacterium]